MTFAPRSIKVGYVLKVFPRLSETFVLNEILELERQGVEVEIFSLKPCTEPRFHARLGSLKAQIHHLDQQGLTSKTWQSLQEEFRACGLDPTQVGSAFISALCSGQLKYLFQALQLLLWVRRLGIDHLHSHFASSASWVALLTHMLSGVSFSFTAHAKDIYHHDADHALLTKALERAAFVITVTDHNVGQLRSYASTTRNKIHRIYNGIPLEDYRPTPKLVNGPPIVLGVGRLVEKKGFKYLVEACRILKRRGVDFRCVLIGTGTEETSLRFMVSDMGLEDTVLMMGAQAHEVVMGHMAKASLLVLPCVVGEDGNRDALPTVLLEAMAAGRPVISTDLPGVTEIVQDEENGLLVPQHNSVALADAMQRLVENPGLGVRLGRAGRKKTEEFFNLPHNVACVAALFRQAILADEDLQAGGGA